MILSVVSCQNTKNKLPAYIAEEINKNLISYNSANHFFPTTKNGSMNLMVFGTVTALTLHFPPCK